MGLYFFVFYQGSHHAKKTAQANALAVLNLVLYYDR